MTDEKFHAMVARLEDLARSNPKGYRWRVTALALLGYFYYVFIVLLMLAGLVGVIVAVYIIFTRSERVPGGALQILFISLAFFGSMAYYLIRAVFVRWQPPDGIELTSEDAPELFAVLKELQDDLALPDLKKVLLNDEFNASVSQVPRYFPGGPVDHYLTLGLPLMDALDAQQVKSVLAHEFGHLSGNHGRASNWIYRLRAMYGRLLQSLEERRSSDFLVRGFLRRYVPYFDAYSFVLARDNEFDADAVAGEKTTPLTAASALAVIHSLDRHLGKNYWENVYRKAAEQAEPPANVFEGMHDFWRDTYDEPTAIKYLEDDFKRPANPYNSHPSLSARLRSLGFGAEHAVQAALLIDFDQMVVRPTGAQVYLGASYDRLIADASRKWKETVAEYWKERYESAREAESKLAEIEPTEAGGNPDKLIEQARYQFRTERIEEGRATCRAILEIDPDNQLALLYLGSQLLGADDEEGLQYLARLDRRTDPGVLTTVAGNVQEFLTDRGLVRESEAFLEKLHTVYVESINYHNERYRVDSKTLWERHDLPPEEMAKLLEGFEGTPNLKRAWIMKKVIPGDPVYIILLERQQRMIELVAESARAKFAADLKVNLEHAHVLMLAETSKWMVKKVKKRGGCLVYERK